MGLNRTAAALYSVLLGVVAPQFRVQVREPESVVNITQARGNLNQTLNVWSAWLQSGFKHRW